MMQGAGDSQDGWGTPIFNMDAQKWTPSGKIANAAFQKITLTNLVRDMKQSGATEQQIGMRVLQYQIAGQALSSYSLSDQVDALYGTGEHADDFAKIGVSKSQIPNVVMDVVFKGKIIGYQGKGTGLPIYEVLVNGQKQRIAVTTGSNVFIVGAHLAGGVK